MHRPTTILLVDDSPGECELFRLALTQARPDAVLHTEYDIEGAMKLLASKVDPETQERLPSLILLDWKLGGQNGDVFLKRLRIDSRFAAIPVVVFTTSDDIADLAAAYAHGANGYVVKPSTFAELIHCAEDLCRYWLHRNLTPSMVTTRC